jgi:2-keto-4-pentenoate hydratase/2-oxohepta-3-ene-1,7-dioic acid hydratase in catechol pathway
MRLLRFGAKGEERPGILNKNNMIVDLKMIYPDIPNIGDEFFRKGWLEKISCLDEPGQRMDVRIGCPVYRPSKIICLGKNYAEHAKEGGFNSPEKPLLFCKTPNTLNGPFDPVIFPQSCGQVDWEVELALIIGREGKRIKRADAYDFVAGYAVMNDVSGRQAQFSDSQWFRGKSFDTFAPLGPVIVTKDEIEDIRNLNLTCKVDGAVMQEGNTKDMIFDIPFIIEYVSRDITLMPGDVISTGTPSGVGIFRNPPVTLNPGNVVECTIEKIGTIRNKIVEPEI